MEETDLCEISLWASGPKKKTGVATAKFLYLKTCDEYAICATHLAECKQEPEVWKVLGEPGEPKNLQRAKRDVPSLRVEKQEKPKVQNSSDALQEVDPVLMAEDASILRVNPLFEFKR